MEHLAPLAAVMRALGDADHRHVVNAGVLHHFADRRQLSLAAIDQQQVRPFAALPVGVFLLQPGEAAFKHLAHHPEIVARGGLRPLDVELAIAVLAEAFGPGDDHRAGRVGAHDVAVVVDLDALRHVGQLERIGQLAQDLALRRRSRPAGGRALPRHCAGPGPSACVAVAALGQLDRYLALGPLRQRFLEQLLSSSSRSMRMRFGGGTSS